MRAAVDVDVVAHVPFHVPSAWLRSTARRALRQVRRAEVRCGRRRRWPASIETALISAGVRRMRSLNLRHRGKDRPTDVLSFPLTRSGNGAHLGDIVICPEVARANARCAGRPYRTEVAVLVLHGLLHLLGYDHETDRGQMAALEREIRCKLGLLRLGDERVL